MNLDSRKLIKILFFYRILMAFVGEFVVRWMVLRGLGDTNLYLNSKPLELIKEHGWHVLTDWVYFPRLIIGTISTVLVYRILTHIALSIIAFYGIYQFLKEAKTDNTRMYNLLILMCFAPSFAIWSSLAGKEALIVFSMGIICAQIIRFFKGEPVKFSVPLVLALWFMSVIKFYYLPFVVLSIVYIFFRQHVRLTWKADLALLLVLLLGTIAGFWLFRYKIDNYTLHKLAGIYYKGARSTRPLMFTQSMDWFTKMPYWLPISLMGPTLHECSLSLQHLCTFIESCFLFVLFLYMLKDVPLCIFRKFSVYYQWLVLGCNCMMFVLFAQYIQGVMNSGAANRYRTNIYIPLLCFAYAFTCVQERVKGRDEE